MKTTLKTLAILRGLLGAAILITGACPGKAQTSPPTTWVAVGETSTPGPDYSQPQYWMITPQNPGAHAVDVLFFHTTTFKDPNYLDPATGATLQELVPPGQYTTSGDIIALPDGYLYWSVTGGDALVRIDPVSGGLTLIGNVGAPGIFGLAWAYGTLYGFTNDGNFLEIDPATAQVVSTAAIGATYWGAATNPVLW